VCVSTRGQGLKERSSSIIVAESRGMGLSQDYGMDDILSETSLPYPAQTKQVVGEISGIVTNVTSISFSDRIMVTITQAGRLAQWVSKLPSLWCVFVSETHETSSGPCSSVRRKPHTSRCDPSTLLQRRRTPTFHTLYTKITPRSRKSTARDDGAIIRFADCERNYHQEPSRDTNPGSGARPRQRSRSRGGQRNFPQAR
jgi:hypothetical protein